MTWSDRGPGSVAHCRARSIVVDGALGDRRAERSMKLRPRAPPRPFSFLERRRPLRVQPANRGRRLPGGDDDLRQAHAAAKHLEDACCQAALRVRACSSHGRPTLARAPLGCQRRHLRLVESPDAVGVLNWEQLRELEAAHGGCAHAEALGDLASSERASPIGTFRFRISVPHFFEHIEASTGCVQPRRGHVVRLSEPWRCNAAAHSRPSSIDKGTTTCGHRWP